jgi:primosomal replication protein N
LSFDHDRDFEHGELHSPKVYFKNGAGATRQDALRRSIISDGTPLLHFTHSIESGCTIEVVALVAQARNIGKSTPLGR